MCLRDLVCVLVADGSSGGDCNCRWPAFTASITFELFRKREIQGPEAAAPAAPSQDRARADDADPNANVVAHPNPGMLQTVLASSPFRRRAKTASEHCTSFGLPARSGVCR